MSTRRKLLYFVGGPAFFFATFVLFAYWSFPYDRVRDLVAARAAKSGILLEIRELSPSWLTGIDAEGVHVTKVDRGPNPRSVTLDADLIHARVSLLSLLTGGTSITFRSEIAGGTIEGEFEADKKATHLALELHDVDTHRLRVIRDYIGLPADGVLDGTIDVTLAKETRESTGNIDLTWRNLSLGDGKAELSLRRGQRGLKIERLHLGQMRARIAIRDGIARFEEVKTSGGRDGTLELTGSIRLAQPFGLSTVDLGLRVKIADAYKNRNDRTRSMFELMDFDPQMSSAKAADGTLNWRFDGTFAGGVRPHPSGRAGG